MWANMGYQGKGLKDHIKKEYGIDIEIVKSSPCRFLVHQDTPIVQPRRWVVERTFAWELIEIGDY